MNEILQILGSGGIKVMGYADDLVILMTGRIPFLICEIKYVRVNR